MSRRFFSRFLLLFFALLIFSGTARAATSPSGTTIPAASRIIDSKGTVWTVAGGKSYENGVDDKGANITLLLYYNGSIYADTTSYGWWSHATGGWRKTSGDPRVSNSTVATTPPVNGACAGAMGTCTGGTPINVTNAGGVVRWTCQGQNGGANAACPFVGVNQAAFADRWFSPASVWNTPIPANPTVIAGYNSAPFQAYAAGGANGINTNLDYWTPAVIEAPPGTPTTTVKWSSWQIQDVPLTGAFITASEYLRSRGDTDTNICLYSDDLGVFFEFGGVDGTSLGNYAVYSGGLATLHGAGWWNNASGPWMGASGVVCGGLIRPSEWASGTINHALGIAWPFTLNAPWQHAVYPATTTDGHGTNSSTWIAQGTIIQLDPTLTDAHLEALGVSSGDLIIAHALQTYGAYDHDSTGGATGGIYFQAGLGNGTTLYPGATTLPKAILSHLRVVAPPAESELPANDSVTTMPEFIN